jgi:type VI secretion system secreted protein Hcp
MHFYVYLKGSKSGAIKGGVTQKGREDSSLAHWYECALETPTDKMTGYSAGKRIHAPLKILKEIDKATPLIYQMACNNEVLTSVILKFWKVGTGKIGTQGTETQHFTITLTNARINALRQHTPEHASDAAGASKSTYEVEEVSFTFQKIDMVWTDGGISASDDWESPV